MTVHMPQYVVQLYVARGCSVVYQYGLYIAVPSVVQNCCNLFEDGLRWIPELDSRVGFPTVAVLLGVGRAVAVVGEGPAVAVVGEGAAVAVVGEGPVTA